MPVIGDCLWVGGWPRETDAPPSTLTGQYDLDNHMRRFCMARHGRSVNVAFLDGHCRRPSRRKDLWKLKWNAEFISTDVTAPVQ